MRTLVDLPDQASPLQRLKLASSMMITAGCLHCAFSGEGLALSHRSPSPPVDPPPCHNFAASAIGRVVSAGCRDMH
jgi:hypothetical protein